MRRVAVFLVIVACSSEGSNRGESPWPGADETTTSGGGSEATGGETGEGPITGPPLPTTTTTTAGPGETTTPTTAGESASGGPPDVEFDLDQVIWLHQDVSSWPETIVLTDVTFEGDSICLDHDISDADPAWPIHALNGDTDVVANPWVFILHDGAWYGATWEWLRPDQTCKSADAVAGDHIKQDPFGEFSGWTAISGDRYYFMVSGLARINGIENVQERSNIVEVIWP